MTGEGSVTWRRPPRPSGTSMTCWPCSTPWRPMRRPGWWEARWAAQVALDAALEAPARVAGLVLLAPAISGDPELDEEAIIAATNGLAEAIDAAWTAGDVDECNRLEVRLWLDGPGWAGGTGERSAARAGPRR